MDIDSMLSVEKRLGIKDSDIDDFLSKADAVEAAIKGMRDGTVDPATVKIEGIDSDEEKAEKERQKQQRLADIKAKNDALALERKKEEHKRWWEGVDVIVPLQAASSQVTIVKTDEEANTEQFHRLRYNSNYSRWDQWVPSDPATKLELEEREKLEEKKRNEEFEKNNKEFCDKYLHDMTEREKEKNKKIQGADSSRLRGNNYFKHKKFDDALKCYMDALKDQPFDPKILINIAQVHIKCDRTEDALEFLARVLRVDSAHTKALSRKGHVLSSLGRIAEALESARKALGNEPDNTDLQRQVTELELAVKTKADEAAIAALKAKACGRSAEDEKATLEKSLRSESDPAVAMKTLEEALELPLLATGFELLDKFAAGEAVDATMNSKCLQLLKADKNMRIYFRTNGALKRTIGLLKDSSAALLGAAGADGAAETACACLQILCAAVTEEAANMAAVVLEVPDLLQYLTSFLHVDFTVSAQLLQFLNLTFDESMSTAPGVLFGYKAMLSKISELIHSVATAPVLQKDSSLRTTCLSEAVKLVRAYLFNESVKSAKIAFPMTNSAGSVLVENLAVSLQVLTFMDNSSQSAVSLNLEALLGCSQYSVLRNSFADSIRAVNIRVDVPCPTPLHVLALLCTNKYRQSSYLPLCLGILMNICVVGDDEAKMKDKIIQSGCLPLVVDIVTADTEKRAATDPLVLARAAGLLARLATSPLAAETLKGPAIYGRVCQRLAENIHLEDRSEKWITDECGYLVRIIASLPSLSEECLQVALKEKLVESILHVFPTPRLEMGEITPSSVVLPPTVAVPAILVGNAARCLMPLAEDSKNGEVLFKQPAIKGVEKLICALSNCSDMRVRKNIAILLAKGARVPEVRSKIERFRGMQMLVELQKQL